MINLRVLTQMAALALAGVAVSCSSAGRVGDGGGLSAQGATTPATPTPPAPGSVIFLHPDGSGANMWQAARLVIAGPDGEMNWDRLPAVALYRGHLSDALTATSNAGGTIHAYGVKVRSESFGQDNNEPIRGASGFAGSIMQEAKAAGLAIGIVNSAGVVDAGTGTFLASVTSRKMYTEIARQMLEAQPEVLLGGGEAYFLPKGVMGRHGEGQREDGVNLIDRARTMGYTVVFTADELASLPASTTRVLGLFAAEDTFNDMPEEEQREKGLPHFQPQAARYPQMVKAAIDVLSRSGRRFLLVAEEEATDNFPGENNAAGTFEAIRGADEAIGIARAFAQRDGKTLVLVAADSDCGGLSVRSDADLDPSQPLPERDENGAPQDGVGGTGTPPFIALPDRAGRRMPFAVVWASEGDCQGAVLARADGYRAEELVRGSFDNTRVYAVLRAVLMGTE
jgi:alkaline phosphatase